MASSDEEPSDAGRDPSSTSRTARGKQRAVPGSDGDQSGSSGVLRPLMAAGPLPGQSKVPKRRRGVGLVTTNACNECRKKRVKCDGRQPCGRCQTHNIDCVYEAPVRQSKEDLRNEIEQLRRRQHSSDTVLNALGQSNLWEEVLRRLQSGESVDSISNWIESRATPRMPGPPPPSRHLSLPLAETQPQLQPPQSLALHHAKPVESDAMMAQFQPGMAANYSDPNTNPAMASMAPYDMPFSQGLSTLGPGMPVQQTVPEHEHPASVQSMDECQNLHELQHLTMQQHMHPHLQQPPLPNFMLPQLFVEHDNHWDDPYTVSQAPSTRSDSHHDLNLLPQSRAGSGDESHLLTLYFCWEYPTFATLSKEHFLLDFHDGRPRYCSSILVNALLALGCRFSTHPKTRANPHDPYTAGDHFYQECQRLICLEEDHHCLTTIQALGIMSIREASCGRESESWFCACQSMRLAMEMRLHLIQRDDEEEDDDDLAVKAATFWGAFALDHAWSLTTGSLPKCSYCPVLPPKPTIVDDIEATMWAPYTDDGSSLQRSCEQPSNVRSVYKCFCELSELVHQSLYILHSPGRPLTNRNLLHMYTKYLDWYDSIPEVLRLGRNFTPAVLFAHMYYHFAILLLFRSLIRLRIIGSSIVPRDVCLQAADAIHRLLRSYSRLYTLQRTPSFVPYFVLTSSVMHLAICASSSGELPPGVDIAGAALPAGGAELTRSLHAANDRAAIKPDPDICESIHQSIADLTEMVPCHHFAEQALHILRYLAQKWNIDVQVTTVTKVPGRSTRSGPGLLDAGVANGFFLGGSAASASLAKAADNLYNPFFWAFPKQWRPMTAINQSLRDAGFELMGEL